MTSGITRSGGRAFLLEGPPGAVALGPLRAWDGTPWRDPAVAVLLLVARPAGAPASHERALRAAWAEIARDDDVRVRLSYRADGGPRLEVSTAPNARISVSHGGAGWSAFVLSRGGRLGVDVECPLSSARMSAAVRRIATEAERMEFERAPLERRCRHFLRWWTAKEALSKACERPVVAMGPRLHIGFDRPAGRPGLLTLDGETAREELGDTVPLGMATLSIAWLPEVAAAAVSHV